MPHYAIGDIQGCYTEFMALLDKIHFNAHEDTLWLAGDIINGGNENLATLRFLKNLYSNSLSNNTTKKPIIVLGNHDLHYLAVFHKVRTIQPDDTFQDILNAPDVEELTYFLQSQSLAHYDATFNTLMIHAGVLPDWTLEKTLEYAKEIEKFLAPNNQDIHFQDTHFSKHNQDTHLLNTQFFLQAIFGTSFEPQAAHLRLITDTLTRIRFCDKSGKLNLVYKGNIDNAPEGLYPWFELTQLRCDILFGHWAALEGKSSKNLFALDTGCVWGGNLTALRLEDKQLFQVPGKKYR